MRPWKECQWMFGNYPGSNPPASTAASVWLGDDGPFGPND
jgi:hypothetical protein